MSTAPIPIQFLRTTCVEGCSSTVLWEYLEGEPLTYTHPGYPDSYEPVEGCTVEHLDRLVNVLAEYRRREPALDACREQFLILYDGAWLAEMSSRRYLRGLPFRTYPSILDDMFGDRY